MRYPALTARLCALFAESWLRGRPDAAVRLGDAVAQLIDPHAAWPGAIATLLSSLEGAAQRGVTPPARLSTRDLETIAAEFERLLSAASPDDLAGELAAGYRLETERAPPRTDALELTFEA